MKEKAKIDDKAKVDSIVCAAQKRFGRFGLGKTTMNEIAEDVGMGKASLYYYFPDKEAIFAAVIKKEQTEFITEMNKMIESDIDPSSQLKKYVKLRNSYFQKFLNLSKLRAESHFNPKPVFKTCFDDFYNNELELIMQMLQNGISKKEFRKINKQEYAELLIHIMAGLRLVKIKYKDIADFDAKDSEDLDRETGKVILMFIKDIKAE
jgi:TetR/AcrR family transcriptional repressor of mexJK operon